MADNFSSYSSSLESPAENGVSVTPNDSADLTTSTRGIYVGVAGDLKIDTVGGDTLTFTSLTAGIIHPIRVQRVYSTGTTATGIIGVW